MLKHADIVGTVAETRQGHGSSHRGSWMKSNNTETLGMVKAEKRQLEEQLRNARTRKMVIQGASTKWTTERKLKWEEIWRMEPHRI